MGCNMPSSVIKRLNEICNPDIFHIIKKSNDGILTLECHEADRSAILKKVEITGFSEISTFKLDKLKFSDTLLKNGHKGRKACDAIIFCMVDNDPYILIFDMKSSSPTTDDHIYQLRSGLLGSRYILELLKEFEGVFSQINWNYRYFIFHCRNNKRETLPEFQIEIKKNTQPDKPHIFETNNSEQIHVRKLLGKPLIKALS